MHLMFILCKFRINDPPVYCAPLTTMSYLLMKFAIKKFYLSILSVSAAPQQPIGTFSFKALWVMSPGWRSQAALSNYTGGKEPDFLTLMDKTFIWPPYHKVGLYTCRTVTTWIIINYLTKYLKDILFFTPNLNYISFLSFFSKAFCSVFAAHKYMLK